MPKFSDAHTRALIVLEDTHKLNSRLLRQQREGHTSHGDRELQRTAHHIARTLELLADSLTIIAAQTQNLGWEQIGDLNHEELTSTARDLAKLAKQLPDQPH
ncbi:hypothetical protein ACIGB6_14435 [Paeniglutamicibacter gangotriensis]|uniref:hypothetical protein n=1 Tax=Paeniglutamicibacter gangotriensis TaxID=254787 RepID=UPI0037CA69C3